MKERKVEIICSVISLFMGIILLICPSFEFNNIKILFSIVLFIYSILNFILCIKVKKNKDYEYLFNTIISVITFLIFIIFYKNNNPLFLSLTIMCFVGAMSINKIIKVDYFMDKKNNSWYIRIVTFCLFILIGILTSINLYYSEAVQTLIIGFFWFINSCLDLSEPVINLLLKSKKD